MLLYNVKDGSTKCTHLCIDGAGEEEDVEESGVGEVTQPRNAREGNWLQTTGGGGRREGGERGREGGGGREERGGERGQEEEGGRRERERGRERPGGGREGGEREREARGRKGEWGREKEEERKRKEKGKTRHEVRKNREIEEGEAHVKRGKERRKRKGEKIRGGQKFTTACIQTHTCVQVDSKYTCADSNSSHAIVQSPTSRRQCRRHGGRSASGPGGTPPSLPCLRHEGPAQQTCACSA